MVTQQRTWCTNGSSFSSTISACTWSQVNSFVRSYINSFVVVSFLLLLLLLLMLLMMMYESQDTAKLTLRLIFICS